MNYVSNEVILMNIEYVLFFGNKYKVSFLVNLDDLF